MIVTGASGYLGREVVRIATAAGWDVVGVARGRRVGGACEWASIDVRDAAGISALSGLLRPAAMIHAAYAQSGPEAESTIVEGSAAVASAAASVGARFVHVSTDMVFGGRPDHYTEDASLSPVDDYGSWKARAEVAVVAACPDAVLVRPSLLYGVERPSGAEVAVLDAVDGRSPMGFFTDEVRCPSHVVDVAAALVALCSRPAVTGPLHLGGPDALTRYEFACLVAVSAGRSADLVRPARRADHTVNRPGHVVLDSRQAARLGLTIRSPIAAFARQ